jgi:hypothetical protein
MASYCPGPGSVDTLRRVRLSSSCRRTCGVMEGAIGCRNRCNNSWNPQGQAEQQPSRVRSMTTQSQALAVIVSREPPTSFAQGGVSGARPVAWRGGAAGGARPGDP